MEFEKYGIESEKELAEFRKLNTLRKHIDTIWEAQDRELLKKSMVDALPDD